MSARPWLKFYRGEWLSNWRLRACSPAARALMIDLIAATDDDGYVRMPLATLAKLFGEPIEGLVAELERGEVLHRGTDGLVLVRTVSRDSAAINHGRSGGLASVAARGSSNPPFERTGKKLRASSSSSGSSSESDSESQRESAEREIEPRAPRGGGGSELTRWWDQEFQATRGVKFDWVRTAGKGGKLGGSPDAIALAQLAKQFPVADIKERISRFLRSTDKWNATHCTPRIFASKYPEFAVEVRTIAKHDQTIANLFRDAGFTNGFEP